jgi:hypothetical protein
LQDEQQQLAVANQQAGTPTALRVEAEDLGMRPSTIGDYRHAKDGRVIGTLTAVPVVVPAPIVTPSSKTAKGKHHGAAGKAGTTKSGTSTKSAKSTKTATSTKAAKSTKRTTSASSGHKAHHRAGHTGASAH